MYLWIGLCGALGAVSRFALSFWIGAHPFPFSTLLVNLIGCFALAFVNSRLAVLPQIPKHVTTAVGTGFIGAFTTFSTFSAQNAELILQKQYLLLGINIGVSLLGGLAAALVGTACGHALCSRDRKDDSQP